MFSNRIERLQLALEAVGLDAVALNPGPSLTYLTGLHFHLMERPVVVFFSLENPPVIVLPELEANKTRQVPFEIQAFTYGENPSEWPDVFRSAGQAAHLNGKKLGIEPIRMRALELWILQAAIPGASFLTAQTVLASLRMQKDIDEVGRMRKAVDIAQRALQAALPLVRVGMTERELATELTLQLMRAGSDPDLPFAPIIASGPNGANPHAYPSDRKLTPGDLVVVDWGATWQDYFSDLTRTLAIGEIDPELHRIVNATLEANAAGRAAARPGVPIGEVDRAARAAIEAAGFGPYFIHRTGHGLGMEEHEEPYASRGNPVEMQAGMTFTVEPGIYLPDRAGVRIEDDILITENGSESLSQMDRDLIVIG